MVFQCFGAGWPTICQVGKSGCIEICGKGEGVVGVDRDSE